MRFSRRSCPKNVRYFFKLPRRKRNMFGRTPLRRSFCSFQWLFQNFSCRTYHNFARKQNFLAEHIKILPGNLEIRKISQIFLQNTSLSVLNKLKFVNYMINSSCRTPLKARSETPWEHMFGMLLVFGCFRQVTDNLIVFFFMQRANLSTIFLPPALLHHRSVWRILLKGVLKIRFPVFS